MKLRSVILSTIVVVLIMAGIITGLSVTKQLDNERICTQLQIIVTDSAERQFVDKAELIRLLRTGGQYPVGKRLNSLSMDSIENIITAHPMVRKAECYPTAQNHIHVVLHQRVPLLKVVTESGNYFIDTDRLPMPVRESVRTNVLIVSGHVGERMAREEIADFAEWLRRNKYWREHIRTMRIVDNKHIYLSQQQGEPVILLGELSGYERKLRKLRTFMEKGINALPDKPTYKELDIRFKDQVIGR